MFRFFGFLILMLSFQLSAAIHTGSITQIDFPKHRQELPLLFLNTGYVLKIKPEHKNDVEVYHLAKKSGATLQFLVNKKREVLGVVNLGIRAVKEIPETKTNVSYKPTVLASEEEAQKIFSTLRPRARKESQCYNRAHIWSFESKKTYKLNSAKVFMFYTRKYIREYNFHWWFHVAPFTYIGNRTDIQERVLDYKYTASPLPMKNWTDIFMQNHAVCPSISKYSQYSRNQEKAYCYLYRASMYYYQPLDLDALERTGKKKTNWIQWEIKNGYRNGFGI